MKSMVYESIIVWTTVIQLNLQMERSTTPCNSWAMCIVASHCLPVQDCHQEQEDCAGHARGYAGAVARGWRNPEAPQNGVYQWKALMHLYNQVSQLNGWSWLWLTLVSWSNSTSFLKIFYYGSWVWGSWSTRSSSIRMLLRVKSVFWQVD